MKIRGRAIKLGDDINTDMIIPFRYKGKTIDPKELAAHVFEDLDPQLRYRIKPGDIVVAGKNFGCGSSREHAPIAIKAAGVAAVVAESFARIFYRNAINIGLPVIEAPKVSRATEDGDTITIDLEEGKVCNETKGVCEEIPPLPRVIRELLLAGGVYEYYRKHGRFPW